MAYSVIHPRLRIATAQKNNSVQPIPLYITEELKNNGCYLEVKLGNSLIALGTFTLNSASILIQGTKP